MSDGGHWLQQYQAANPTQAGIYARILQITAIQDEVLECVSWDDFTGEAGDSIVYVAKPEAFRGETVSPDYEEDDFILALQLPQSVL